MNKLDYVELIELAYQLDEALSINEDGGEFSWTGNEPEQMYLARVQQMIDIIKGQETIEFK